MNASTNLRKDTTGAIMVLGLFMAVFLVGILYYVIGIADAIFYRERMQDAADAAAFSSAVVHARGMNILVLINLIMVSLLAILVMLKLVSTVALAGMGICAGLAWISGGTTATYIPLLKGVKTYSDKAYNLLDDPIYEILDVLHNVSGVVKIAMPVVAQGRAIETVVTKYSPPAELGFVWPVYQELPAEDDTFEELCRRAGEAVGHIADIPFNSLPVPLGFGVGDAIGGLIGELAGTFSGYFCGDQGGNQYGGQYGNQYGNQGPPSAPYKENVNLPKLRGTNGQNCYEAKQRIENGNVLGQDDLEEACADAVREIDESKPDEDTGECAPENNLCRTRVERARDACLVTPETQGSFKDFEWAERNVTRVYTKTPDNQVIELVDERIYGPSERLGGAKDEDDWRTDIPCIPQTRLAWTGTSLSRELINLNENWTPWNKDMVDVFGDPAPLCHEKYERPAQDSLNKGERREVSYREVSQIIGCTRRLEKKVKIDEQLGDPGARNQDSISVGFGSNEEVSNDTGNAYSPQKIKEGTILGSELFQLRAFVLGKDVSNRGEKGVKIATWEGSPELQQQNGFDSTVASIGEKLRFLGKFSVAQAEYFYDEANTDPKEWLWHMNWRARLRRFRFSEGEGESGAEGQESQPLGGFSDIGSACAGSSTSNSSDGSADNSCNEASGATDIINRFIVH